MSVKEMVTNLIFHNNNLYNDFSFQIKKHCFFLFSFKSSKFNAFCCYCCLVLFFFFYFGEKVSFLTFLTLKSRI